MGIDLNLFIERIRLFQEGRRTRRYTEDFDNFWKYKLEVESFDEHPLDYRNIGKTRSKLLKVLRGWQYFRPMSSEQLFEDALNKISYAYNQVRKYTLLEFNEIPDEHLKTIWHQLGRVKEPSGRTNPRGYYNVISICKPLMLLWGQTPAFDSKVRIGIYGFNRKAKNHRWDFELWRQVMESLRYLLVRNHELVKIIKELTVQKYGSEATVPFGRFLDMFYWQSYP